MKNNYLCVMNNIYIYLRDDIKTPVWQYYFRIKNRAHRGSTGKTDISDAKTEACRVFFDSEANPKQATSAKHSFKNIALRWLELNATHTDYDNKQKAVLKFFIPYFADVIKLVDISAIQPAHINDYMKWRRDYYITGPGFAPEKKTYQRGGRTVVAKAEIHKVPANNTLNRENQNLRLLLGFAVQEGLLGAHAKPDVPTQKGEKSRRPDFTTDQADKVCRLARERADQPPIGTKLRRERRQILGMVMMLRYSGMRPKEIHSLVWQDVDLTERKIRLRAGKTGSRLVPILFDELIAELKALRDDRKKELGQAFSDGESLFVNPTGQPIASFKRAFSNLMDACGFVRDDNGDTFSQYSFRHAFATVLGNQGMPSALLTKCLGTSTKMLDAHYDHNTANDALKWMADQKKARAQAMPTPDAKATLQLDTSPSPALTLKKGALVLGR